MSFSNGRVQDLIVVKVFILFNPDYLIFHEIKSMTCPRTKVFVVSLINL